MLATLLLPTANTATVAGHDLIRQPREVRRHIGYVAQVGGALRSAGIRLGEELVTQARSGGGGTGPRVASTALAGRARRAHRILPPFTPRRAPRPPGTGRPA